MPMVASKKDMEEQNTGKGIVLLAVTACNWVKKNEVPKVSEVNCKSFYLTF